MPVSVTISGWDEFNKASEHVKEARRKLFEGIKMDLVTYQMNAIRKAKSEYLSGPRPERLGVVSGRLRSSIGKNDRVEEDGEILTATIGTNVKYAAIHEFGFDGVVNIPAFTRTISKVFGRDVAPVNAKVRGHSRKLHMRKRAFLYPAMEEVFPQLVTSIEKRMRELTLVQ